MFFSIRFAAVLCLAAGIALPQSKRPVSKRGLLEALRIGGLSEQELAALIARRSVDFRPTPADDAELRTLGASPGLIASIRNSYRAPQRPVRRLPREIGATLMQPRPLPPAPEPLIPEPLPSEPPDGAALRQLEPQPRPMASPREVSRVYVERFASRFDEALAAEWNRHLGGRIELVPSRDRAEAVLVADGASIISLYDATGWKLLWTDEVEDRGAFGRKRTPRAIAERIAARLRKAIEP